MKGYSASHLIGHPISFEFFLFFYLTCALLLQKINIYKTVSTIKALVVSINWNYQAYHSYEAYKGLSVVSALQYC
jgi:hypothetical protein